MVSEFAMPGPEKTLHKNDPVANYCTQYSKHTERKLVVLANNSTLLFFFLKISVKQDPLLKKISDDTLKNHPHGKMIGAPEVHQLGQNMIRLIRAKKALDIGTFTGASAVAWSLALPSDGQVISMDVSHDAFKQIGEQAIKAREDVAKKITFKLEPALQTLGK
ncbi:unnamed protein product [Enterobius vermicularis]|uniref:Methyltransf_25 domain-containing protein n=1 Tax=Enterobius vermicularis TaxID=51028 RepID=A0A0N4VDM1_ENTVE|nr:unnamed protein product [Enterobius vermicularis]